MSPLFSDLAGQVLVSLGTYRRRFLACDPNGRLDPLELSDLCSRVGVREAHLNEAISELLQEGYLRVSVAEFEGVAATGVLEIVESEYPYPY